MRQNPHVRICGGPGSATTLVYPTGLGLQVSPLYGNIGLGVTGVLVALYVYLGFVRGKSP